MADSDSLVLSSTQQLKSWSYSPEADGRNEKYSDPISMEEVRNFVFLTGGGYLGSKDAFGPAGGRHDSKVHQCHLGERNHHRLEMGTCEVIAIPSDSGGCAGPRKRATSPNSTSVFPLGRSRKTPAR